MRPSERLTSWKEVAAYLGCDERTAQRWEAECGLPVHRTPGRKRGLVFAFGEELDNWLKQDQNRLSADRPTGTEGAENDEQSPKKERTVVPIRQVSTLSYVVCFGAATVLLLISSVVIIASFRVKPVLPTRLGLTASAIQAFDDHGRILWTHQLSKSVDPDYLNHPEHLTSLVRFVDSRNAGDRKIIVSLPLRTGPNPSDQFVTEIDCFSSAGLVLWSYVPNEAFRFGTYELRGPWRTLDMFVSSNSSKPKMWATLAHYEWGNSFVVELELATGHTTLRFVNTGIVYNLNEIQISGKSYLLASGFNNEYAAGSLAVIDESKEFAVSPQTAGTRHECKSCPVGEPDYYFVFPRSEINLERNAWEDSVKSTEVSGQNFEVSKMELGNGGPEPNGPVRSIYLFHTQPAIEPFSFRFDSSYDLLHGQLEKEHKLNHSLEMCPERLHPTPVRVWRPFTGWARIELSPVRSVD